MATFPSLAPSAAPVTPGAWPVSAISSINGAESRIRQGSAQIGRRLRLTFPNVTEASLLAILAHYQGQRSGFDPFGFDTTTLAADLTPSGHAWLYASRPQVVDEHLDVFTVVCEFKSEPRGLVVAAGRRWRTGATTLAAGTGADGVRVAAGKQLATTSTTLTPGARSSGIGSNGVVWATSSTVLAPGSIRDPYFSSVSLLLNMNGSNGSTTFTDSSSNGLTLTAFGNAAISTAQSRFGSASGAFDGNGDYLTAPVSSGGFDFGSGDFTIEASVRTTTTTGNQTIANVFPDNTSTASWRFLIVANILQFICYNSTGTLFTISSSACISTNTWTDVAAVRSGSTLTIYCNGSQVGSGSISGAIRSSDAGAVFNISRQQSSTDVWLINGNLDEIRITKGVARSITSNTAAFPGQ
jgi:hypothetical protein